MLCTCFLSFNVKAQNDIVNKDEQFMCIIGTTKSKKYPMEFKSLPNGDDIKKLKNGKSYPLLSRLKTNLNQEEGWKLVYKKDTTNIEKVDIIVVNDETVDFKAIGKAFTKKINSFDGLILKLKENLIVFMDSKKQEWTLFKEE